MPFVLLLSLIIFGSVVAAFMPVLVGGVAVVGALAVVRLITLFTDVSIFSINVITLLGMGLAIDYALFVVSRFREELDAGRDPIERLRVGLEICGGEPDELGRSGRAVPGPAQGRARTAPADRGLTAPMPRPDASSDSAPGWLAPTPRSVTACCRCCRACVTPTHS